MSAPAPQAPKAPKTPVKSDEKGVPTAKPTSSGKKVHPPDSTPSPSRAQKHVSKGSDIAKEKTPKLKDKAQSNSPKEHPRPKPHSEQSPATASVMPEKTSSKPKVTDGNGDTPSPKRMVKKRPTLQPTTNDGTPKPDQIDNTQHSPNTMKRKPPISMPNNDQPIDNDAPKPEHLNNAQDTPKRMIKKKSAHPSTPENNMEKKQHSPVAPDPEKTAEQVNESQKSSKRTIKKKMPSLPVEPAEPGGPSPDVNEQPGSPLQEPKSSVPKNGNAPKIIKKKPSAPIPEPDSEPEHGEEGPNEEHHQDEEDEEEHNEDHDGDSDDHDGDGDENDAEERPHDNYHQDHDENSVVQDDESEQTYDDAEAEDETVQHNHHDQSGEVQTDDQDQDNSGGEDEAEDDHEDSEEDKEEDGGNDELVPLDKDPDGAAGKDTAAISGDKTEKAVKSGSQAVKDSPDSAQDQAHDGRSSKKSGKVKPKTRDAANNASNQSDGVTGNIIPGEIVNTIQDPTGLVGRAEKSAGDTINKAKKTSGSTVNKTKRTTGDTANKVNGVSEKVASGLESANSRGLPNMREGASPQNLKGMEIMQQDGKTVIKANENEMRNQIGNTNPGGIEISVETTKEGMYLTIKIPGSFQQQ